MLVRALGRPGYGTLEDPVLVALARETSPAASLFAEEISLVPLRASVLALDVERREVLLRDRRGKRYRLRIADDAVVPPGALQVGRTVLVTLDLRTQLVRRVQRGGI